jgi:hypothetical protein
LFVVVVLVERGQQNQFNPRGRQCSRTLLTVDELMIEMREVGEFLCGGQETVTRTSFQGKPRQGHDNQMKSCGGPNHIPISTSNHG